jgi:hypothetical protein
MKITASRYPLFLGGNHSQANALWQFMVYIYIYICVCVTRIAHPSAPLNQKAQLDH